MLKKRFFWFLLGFAFLVVFFNFSLVSASLEGVAKIRLLSLSMILSILEITIAAFIFWIFFKSAAGFSQKEKQLSLILNNTEQGIVVHDNLNEILFLNLQAEKILGVKFKDVVGIRLSQESSLRNPKFEKIIEIVFFSKISGEENFAVESREVFEKSRRFFIKTLSKTGAPKAISGIEFVTTAAYQLRTPLSGVKWIFKMLLEKPGLSPDQISLLKNGQDVNERVIKIVNDLLDAAKIESGKLSYDFRPVNLVSFIDGLVSDFSEPASKKGVRLVFNKSGETPPNIKADAVRLRMALGNIIDNAIKYTQKDGGIKVTLARKNNFAEISVSDTGIGIPEEERAKIFSKFFKVGNAAKVDSGGAGLGLFIAYRIVSDHGGQMRFAPNSPEGSIFSFTVPFSREFS